MDTGEIIQWVSTIAGTGFVTTIATGLFNKKKANTDSASVLTSSAISLLGPMRLEMDELQKDLKETKEELKAAQMQVTEFRIEMRRLLVEMSGYRELTSGENQIVSGY